MTALVGKYFIGVHDGCMRSGIVEAEIDPRHYLVRFDDVIGFTHGSEWPASLAVVAISDMTQGGMDKDEPPPWVFFDDEKQRARYDECASRQQIERRVLSCCRNRGENGAGWLKLNRTHRI